MRSWLGWALCRLFNAQYGISSKVTTKFCNDDTGALVFHSILVLMGFTNFWLFGFGVLRGTRWG